ncbi:MAG: hypothetical protein JPMHGGIA_00481 [Saprospiraceae bacterium]|nr:hypothetical protein [Saprospiraceae bacterium]
MKLKKILIACSCFLLVNQTMNAQCGVVCEDVTLTIPDCETLEGLENLIHITTLEGCTVSIYDIEGNLVPNPVPADIQYVCQNLRVQVSNGEQTCESNLYIGLTTTLAVYPPEFRSLSLRNYEMGNAPRPRVEACTWGLLERTLSWEDQFIGICHVVPKVVRSYTVTDRCGNSGTATHTFDLVGDISCHILGPNRVPIGSSLLLKSQNTPKGFNPFNSSWQVIGDDWTVRSDKLDPSKAVLTPGPVPGQATVILDLWDRFGCSRSCEKIFTSYISKGNLDPRSSSGQELELIVRNDEVQLHFSKEQMLESVRLINLAGTIMASAEPSGDTRQLSLPMNGLEPGIYIVQWFSGSSMETRRFFKF